MRDPAADGDGGEGGGRCNGSLGAKRGFPILQLVKVSEQDCFRWSFARMSNNGWNTSFNVEKPQSTDSELNHPQYPSQ